MQRRGAGRQAQALQNLARRLRRMNGGDDPQTGMKILRKVIELCHEGRLQAEADFYLGMGYRRLADETKAHAQFKKALALDPSFIPATLAS